MQAQPPSNPNPQPGIILIPFPGTGLRYFLDHTPDPYYGRKMRVLHSASYLPSPTSLDSASELAYQSARNAYIREIIAASKMDSLIFIDDGLDSLLMLAAYGVEYRIIYPSWGKFEGVGGGEGDDEEEIKRRENEKKAQLALKLQLWNSYEFVTASKRVVLEGEKWLGDAVREVLAEGGRGYNTGSGLRDGGGEAGNREGEGGNREGEQAGEDYEWGGEGEMEGDDWEWNEFDTEDIEGIATGATVGEGEGLTVDHCTIRALPLSFSNIIVNSPHSQNKEYIAPSAPSSADYRPQQRSRFGRYAGRELMLANLVLFCCFGYALYRLVSLHTIWLESEAEGRLAMFMESGHLLKSDWRGAPDVLLRKLLGWSVRWANGIAGRGSATEGLLESIEKWVMVEKMLRDGKLGEKFEAGMKR